MNFKIHVLIISLLSIVAGTALAEWSTIKASSIQISAPPDADVTRTELETLHHFEQTRTDMDCKLAASQALPSFDKFFVNKLHPVLTTSEATALKAFVTKAMNTASSVAGAYKNKYSRPRPLTEDSSLKPCVLTPSGSLSYPSAHSAMALAGACAIGKILPDQAGDVLKYANYLAELRAVIGVHHPSDVFAGKAIGTQLCEAWSKDISFTTEATKLQKALKLTVKN